MRSKPIHDIELLRQLISYDPESGKLFWKERDASLFADPRRAAGWNTKHAGKEAFTATNSDGYKVGRVFNCYVRAHNIAYALHNGEWPPDEIDHENQNPADNRACNLVLSDRIGNLRNRSPRKNSSYEVYGVTFGNRNKWVARIGRGDGTTEYLGSYDTFEEAKTVRLAAEKRYGYHPNHGKR